MKLRGSIDVSNDQGPTAQLPMGVNVERRRCQSGDIKLTIHGQKADRDVKKIDIGSAPGAGPYQVGTTMCSNDGDFGLF